MVLGCSILIPERNEDATRGLRASIDGRSHCSNMTNQAAQIPAADLSNLIG